MHIFMIFMLLFGCYSTLTNSRPSLQEETDSEIGGSEYESDESVDDEYVPEEGDSAGDEAPQELVNRELIQNSEDQELIQNSRRSSNKHLDNNREGSEKFPESEMRDKNRNNPHDVRYRSERFSFVKEHPKYIFGSNNAAESDGSQSSSADYQKNRVEYRNSEQLASDDSGDLLFKRFHDHMKTDKNDYVEDANERSDLKKQYDRPLENKATKKYDYVYSPDRNRRQVQNLDEKPVTVLKKINENNNLDVVNESAILKNIKKLSEQDLEDLMNSLPEDKKALLKKIMDKREITKKAGAIEDDSCLDQSDTSKIEGSYSVNTNSVSSLLSNSDTTETNKHIESGGGLNTKVSDSESESGKSGNKPGDISDTTGITTEELLENTDTSLKDDANINSNNKECSKSENKREINHNYFSNENAPLDNSLILDTKSSNDLPIQEESSENEDWLEPQNEDLFAEQEVSQDDPSDLSASVEKLEESFPSANAYGDRESDLEPLIRIKRKESQHKVKKRDLPFLANDNISFISDFENEGSENDERNEFHYKEPPYSQSDCLTKDVHHYLTVNKEIRKKRTSNPDEFFNNTFNDTIKLNRSSDTIHDKNNLAPDHPMDKSQYHIDEAFGSFAQNSEENFNRYKRIRRVKNVSNSSIMDE